MLFREAGSGAVVRSGDRFRITTAMGKNGILER